MAGKRKSILSDLERNYDNTKSISKSVDLASIENKVNPHSLYNNMFKDIEKEPESYTKNNFQVGDIVYMNSPKNQFEIINIINKNNIVLKNMNTNDVIITTDEKIKPIMENIDMAKKEINETQYSVSINGLETTDANALSQMMSAAALADSGSADVGGLDMTSAPELPTPENPMDPLSLDSTTNDFANPAIDSADPLANNEPMIGDETGAVEEPTDDMASDIEEPLSADIENPLENPEPDMEDDFNMESETEVEEPIDDMEITESELNESRPDKEDFINDDLKDINENVLQELYEIICDQKGDDYLSDYDEVDHMELIDCVKDFGNDIEGFDESLAEEYANALQEKWKNENTEDGSDYEDFGKPNWENEEELSEDILLPKETEDETYNASKKLKDDEEDEDAERISESMEALIKSILENADAKSEQEVYAEEISETNDESEKSDESEELEETEDLDSDIAECLKYAGITLDEATVKPTIVTDESSFANKPNKALKPEDKKAVEKKTVSTDTFGEDASEGFKEPLNCIRCEAVSPKEKIKAIYETAKVRYSKTSKDEWNALDRRYIRKLIENGCGYTRASKIILEAKKKK